MKKPLVLLPLLLAPVLSYSQQDVQLREEAVRLLERANAVSSAPDLPNLERTDTFRVFADGSAREGSFSRVVIQGTGRRDEVQFGDYHVVKVWTEEGLTSAQSNLPTPPEVRTLMRLAPVLRVSFDHEDIIRRISNRPINGRAARCIAFDTVAGEKSESNELCVDVANGALVEARLGSELIENSNFFPFSGALLPGNISYSVAGVRRMEIAQSMAPLGTDSANVLAAPPDATLHRFCTTYRRAFGVSMPQPKPGNGGGTTDIVVSGIIGHDGKVHDAAIQSSDRPDLNPEALTLIQQWTFAPALCNGKPNQTEASFALHFQGR